ncbi:hypothetical protein [Halarcobacter ebronensis]|uniref:Uncharacterized protein n=1 Tax=Halarcobacter ebronensis TaxID=1462615 RepID=A0A4Q1AT36_9BACT|nr:hypothetical protein [Halarcobacter ebronensis]QKF82059.1 hypothetical protein AEBR_1576 [Halarcobacter ebronensis]RXK04109.1 hypothetical protein CRV07_11825 [Halarcobacter ebronensis]
MWTSYNEDGTLQTFDKPETQTKIYEIVSDTLPDYEVPSNAEIKNGAADVLKSEAAATINFLDDVASGFADGVKAFASSSKYIPYFLLIGLGIFILNKSGVKQ